MRRTRPAPPKATLRTRPSASRLDALIEEATVDAYGESEQKTGFFTMLENHLAVPFSTGVLGITVTVETIDMIDDEAIVAVCVRARLLFKPLVIDAADGRQRQGARELEATTDPSTNCRPPSSTARSGSGIGPSAIDRGLVHLV